MNHISVEALLQALFIHPTDEPVTLGLLNRDGSSQTLALTLPVTVTYDFKHKEIIITDSNKEKPVSVTLGRLDLVETAIGQRRGETHYYRAGIAAPYTPNPYPRAGGVNSPYTAGQPGPHNYSPTSHRQLPTDSDNFRFSMNATIEHLELLKGLGDEDDEHGSLVLSTDRKQAPQVIPITGKTIMRQQGCSLTYILTIGVKEYVLDTKTPYILFDFPNRAPLLLQSNTLPY